MRQLFESRRNDFLLISVQTHFANKLLSSKKTIELRRNFPTNLPTYTPFLLYSSKIEKAVVGFGFIEKVVKFNLDELWLKTREFSEVSLDFFESYFDGKEFGFAVYVNNVQEISERVSLSCLNSKFSISPPQSYRYLNKEQFDQIKGM